MTKLVFNTVTEVLHFQNLANEILLVSPDVLKVSMAEVTCSHLLNGAIRHTAQELADTFDWYKVFLV